LLFGQLTFDGYIDNLLAPEKRATSPSSSDIINGFSLEDDNHYNEFQSDSNATNDNTVKVTTFISKKLSQWVGFNAVSNKNTLSFGVNIGFKFSKLPWIVNECVGQTFDGRKKEKEE
jgi:hypothetical protein